MKKNGFTLVELIITISIFGLMMLVSVPNVTSMVDKNKRKVYVNDAKKLVKLARYKFYTTYKDTKPASGTCLTYNVSNLDMSNLEAPPNGGTYNSGYSFVKITYASSTYMFRVQLVEKYTTSAGAVRYRGVYYSESSALDNTNAKAAVVSDVLPQDKFNAKLSETPGFRNSSSTC